MFSAGVIIFRPYINIGKEKYALRSFFSIFAKAVNQIADIAQSDGLAEECPTTNLRVQVRFPAPARIFFTQNVWICSSRDVQNVAL